MTLLWWHWIVAGLFLVMAEMAGAGGFFIIFFGIGALFVGAMVGLGIGGPVWMQLLLFSVLSVVSLVLFRARLVKSIQSEPQQPDVDTLVGEVGPVGNDIAPGAIGKIEIRGADWSARNTTSAALSMGVRCRVVRVEGLTLDIEPEGARL